MSECRNYNPKVISSIEIVGRQKQGKPTVVIDIRDNTEVYSFFVVDPQMSAQLCADTYAGCRISLSELSANNIENLKKWQSKYEEAIIVVASTRITIHCQRVAAFYNKLLSLGFSNVMCIDMHLFDFYNTNFGKRLPKLDLSQVI